MSKPIRNVNGVMPGIANYMPSWGSSVDRVTDGVVGSVVGPKFCPVRIVATE